MDPPVTHVRQNNDDTILHVIDVCLELIEAPLMWCINFALTQGRQAATVQWLRLLLLLRSHRMMTTGAAMTQANQMRK